MNDDTSHPTSAHENASRPTPRGLAQRARALAAALVVLLSATALHAQPALMVYDFTLDGTPAANIDHVRSLGYRGLVTRVGAPADLSKLSAYAAHAATLDDFQVFAYVVYNFASAAVSEAVWRDALPILASARAPLWVVVRQAPSAAAIRELLEEMAITSQGAGVRTVVYPHWGASIETAAEASAIIAEVGHPNLQNSIHTCHEILGGNQRAMADVVAAYADETALVTIAGADEGVLPAVGVFVNWNDVIKPLDQGDSSLLPFLEALADEGYDGPVILQTFGITGDPDHLHDSLDQYAAYIALVRGSFSARPAPR